MNHLIIPLVFAFQAGGNETPAVQTKEPLPANAAGGSAFLAPWQVFLCAVFGSVAVEVGSILATYKANQALPPEYYKAGFWVVRILMTIIAGALAIIFGAQTLTLAFQIGATAPAFIERTVRSS